jgi:hypothetical protein
MFDDLIEIHVKLQKNRQEIQNESNTANDRYKLRIAAIEREKQKQKEMERKIIELSFVPCLSRQQVDEHHPIHRRHNDF